MEENTMKCPFRQDKMGELMDCYGKACMAYFELPIVSMEKKDAPEIPCCRKLFGPVPFYSGGCSLTEV